MTFGENLRLLRTSRGYTQEKFARILQSNQANITAWERGTRMPNIETIRFIAKTFNVPVSSLIPISDSGSEDDLVSEVAEAMHQNPKIRLLFDHTRRMSQKDLDVVISVVQAISKERNNE